MARFPNPHLVKIHRSYTVTEAAETLRVHKNTVRAWLKAGLPTVDDSRHALILGRELRADLERKRASAKRPTPPGMIYCLKCRGHTNPAEGVVEYIPLTPTTGNLRALCATCGKLIHRRVSRAGISIAIPNLTVRMLEGESHLRESACPSLNCNIQTKG